MKVIRIIFWDGQFFQNMIWIPYWNKWSYSVRRVFPHRNGKFDVAKHLILFKKYSLQKVSFNAFDELTLKILLGYIAVILSILFLRQKIICPNFRSNYWKIEIPSIRTAWRTTTSIKISARLDYEHVYRVSVIFGAKETKFDSSNVQFDCLFRDRRTTDDG